MAEQPLPSPSPDQDVPRPDPTGLHLASPVDAGDERARDERIEAILLRGDLRDRAAERRDRAAEARDQADCGGREAAVDRDWAARDRDQAAMDRADLAEALKGLDPTHSDRQLKE